ncbi:MAG: SHOCT domain-containing protein, partial [Anaerolineales bacterium]
ARRAVRRTSRRTTRRVVRRTRRRIIVGGAVLLAVGGAAYGAYKLSQPDVEKVEQCTGKNADDLTEEELLDAMDKLGIQKLELTDEDKAAIEYEDSSQVESAAPASQESYIDELEKLADLRDRGVISEEDFEKKKQQLLGL